MSEEKDPLDEVQEYSVTQESGGVMFHLSRNWSGGVRSRYESTICGCKARVSPDTVKVSEWGKIRGHGDRATWCLACGRVVEALRMGATGKPETREWFYVVGYFSTHTEANGTWDGVIELPAEYTRGMVHAALRSRIAGELGESDCTDLVFTYYHAEPNEVAR